MHESPNIMSSENHDCLNWLATQYVLGELSENARHLFEERLATDLAACEAVAAASHLTLTLRAAVKPDSVAFVVPPQLHCRSSQYRSWIGLAGAAAAVVIVAVAFSPSASRTPQLTQADHTASELVAIWRNEAVDPNGGGADEADVEVTVAGQEIAVPGWLLAAVSLEQGKATGNSSEEWQEN